MGIIKNLGKRIGNALAWTTVWPIPEYLVVASTIIDTLVILDDAYKAEAKNKEVVAYGENEYEITQKVEAGPADVWNHIIPGSDNWSVREAVKVYRELDEDGRVIFLGSAVSVGMKLAAIAMTTFRYFSLVKAGRKYANLYRKEAAANKNTEEYILHMSRQMAIIVDSLENPNHKMDTVNERIHFKNYVAIKDDLDSMLGETKLIRGVA